jgi:hypothetical protein
MCLPRCLQRNVKLFFLMNRYKIRDLFADKRCSWAILDFLRSTKVGQRVDEDKDHKMKNSNSEREEEGDGEEKGANIIGSEGGGGAVEAQCLSFLSLFPSLPTSPFSLS